MLLYDEDRSTYGVSVAVLAFTVPPTHNYKLQSFIGWGDASAEFEIWVDNVRMSGCRSSDQNRTVQIWWDGSHALNSGQTVTVLGTHFSQGLLSLKCNLVITRF